MGKNHLGMVAAATIVAALGLASCTGVSPSSFYEQQETEKYKVIDHIIGCNVVVIYSDGVGSGVVYRKNGKHYVLTASHIIADTPEIITQDPKGDDLSEPLVNQTFGTKPILICSKDNEDSLQFASVGKVAYVDPHNDFAILELEREPPNEIQSSEFYTGKVRVGERVFTVGNTTLDANNVSSGIIQHANRDPLADPSDRKFIQTDCAGGPGLSGGGLYRAIDGKCIGIIIIKNSTGQCLYAMPITKIREVLSNSSRKDLTP